VDWLKNTIGTPEQAHGVTSEAAYRAWALAIRKRMGVKSVPLRDVKTKVTAYVSHGRWVVQCGCGNCPSAHPGGAPGWPEPVAVCVECGAVFRPTFAESVEDVEAVLLARPEIRTRDYYPTKEIAQRHGVEARDTLAALKKQNTDHGHPEEKGR
jgi:hypothetical protein